jgi:hypothetical protein
MMGWYTTFTTACYVRVYQLAQFVRNLFLYYLWHPKFFFIELTTFALYFFQSPFRLIRKFDENHPDQAIGPYGETDFRAFEKLLDGFSIPKTATLADLGSGRGRLCFWLSCVRGQSHVVGVEREIVMVERALSIRHRFNVKQLSFQFGDWEKVHLDEIDVFYLYGPAMSDERIVRAAAKLQKLPVGTKIITVSAWLGEVMPDRFQLVKTLPIRFPWGKTEAFLQMVN